MERAEVREIFERWFDNLSNEGNPEVEYDDRHPDCVIEHPQSGEVFDRDGMIGMQREYPDPSPPAEIVRITGHGDEWTVEATLDYGPDRGGKWPVVVTCAFQDGKIIRETRYFAEPFEAPEWRLKYLKNAQS